MRARGVRMAFIPALLLAAAWLMGMGGGSGNGGAAGSIPIPDRSFTVTVTDTAGNSVEAERFTWEGKTHFKAEYGNATVTLPFEKVSRVEVLHESETVLPERVLARVILRTGESIEVSLERSSKCYGDTRFGAYEIFLKDVQAIEIGEPS